MSRARTSMDGHFSFASCPSDEDVNIFGIPWPPPAAFVKNSEGRIAMQPECAFERVTLMHGRTSESLHTALSVARFKPGSVYTRTTRVPGTWRGTRGEIPGAPPANLAISRRLCTGPSYEIRRFSFAPSRLSSVQPSISGDNIVYCRNGGIKHRSGETLNTRARFIARWIAAHGARSSEVSWDTGGRYAQLFRKLFYVGATLFVPLLPL